MRQWTEGLRLGDHVLHLYHDGEEQERAVIDMFNWLPKGGKMLYFSPGPDPAAILGAGNDVGERLRAASREGRFETHLAERVYCPQGVFRGKDMLRNLARAVEGAESEGFSSLVAVGDASWLSDVGGIGPELLRYEASVNFLDLPLDAAFMCQYDQRIFPPDHLGKVKAVHDQLLVDRNLDRNCWILPRKGTDRRMLFSP